MPTFARLTSVNTVFLALGIFHVNSPAPIFAQANSPTGFRLHSPHPVALGATGLEIYDFLLEYDADHMKVSLEGDIAAHSIPPELLRWHGRVFFAVPVQVVHFDGELLVADIPVAAITDGEISTQHVTAKAFIPSKNCPLPLEKWFVYESYFRLDREALEMAGRVKVGKRFRHEVHIVINHNGVIGRWSLVIGH